MTGAGTCTLCSVFPERKTRRRENTRCNIYQAKQFSAHGFCLFTLINILNPLTRYTREGGEKKNIFTYDISRRELQYNETMCKNECLVINKQDCRCSVKQRNAIHIRESYCTRPNHISRGNKNLRISHRFLSRLDAVLINAAAVIYGEQGLNMHARVGN